VEDSGLEPLTFWLPALVDLSVVPGLLRTSGIFDVNLTGPFIPVVRATPKDDHINDHRLITHDV
jgi:hypothetical protein